MRGVIPVNCKDFSELIYKKKSITSDKQLVMDLFWWAHLDLNQGPTDYESVALTI